MKVESLVKDPLKKGMYKGFFATYKEVEDKIDEIKTEGFISSISIAETRDLNKKEVYENYYLEVVYLPISIGFEEEK